MARKPRQFEVGNIYHVLNRGHEKRDIFLDEGDRIRFIESLYYFNAKDTVSLRDQRRADKQILGNRGLTPVACEIDDKRERIVDVLAFALMPNHFHLILREISAGGISAFMQKISTGYTTYFNEKYARKGVGGIFQGRYKGVHIKDDRQLSVTFVYVHTNPVEIKEPAWKEFKVRNKRNAINWLTHYTWSSYHDYVGTPTFPVVTQRGFFLEFYGGEKECRQAVEDWILFKAENFAGGPEIIE